MYFGDVFDVMFLLRRIHVINVNEYGFSELNKMREELGFK
jgi:hypothetical protein